MLFKISLAMLAFAANSLLCRIALVDQHIDAMSFSAIRVISGVLMLGLLMLWSHTSAKIEWNIKSGTYLAVYIVAFSLAYLKIDAGLGALLLFGTVQVTMAIYGITQGEVIHLKSGIGLVLAFSGILLLLLPGTTTPNLGYACMMMISGLAWAAYSLSGKNMINPLSSTMGNFMIAMPLVLCALLFFIQDIHINGKGLLLAIASGALASSSAYVLWYSILKQIDRITASTLQLSVPCIAILGGVLFLDEVITLRMVISTLIVLSGIALVTRSNHSLSKAKVKIGQSTE